jgi:2-dehydro-3-deoxyglucarate aldolase
MDLELGIAVAAVRERIGRGEASVGTWVQIPSPDVAELIAWGGFDWVVVDAEHGAVDLGLLPDMARAIASGGSIPMVRLATADASACARALDAGMCGVIAPRIENADQILAVRSASRWPPLGTRGVGFARANRYGADFQRAIQQPVAPLVVGMIESKAGVDNVRDIVAVEGLDALFIGPYDLSASLGVPGEVEHESVGSAVREIRAAAAEAGVPVGLHSVSPNREVLHQAIEDGFTFLAFSTDAQFLTSAATSPLAGALRGRTGAS